MARRTKVELLPAQREVREAFGEALWDGVSAILSEEDPLGLVAAGAPQDEYTSEVESILLRLSACASADDTRAVVFEEFERWFGTGRVGPPQRYVRTAERVWTVWQQRE